MINIDLLPTTKFKTTLITLRMIAPFEKKSINSRAIIPQILAAGTKHYKSKAGMSRRLDSLFGSQLNVYTLKIGLASVIHFSIQFPSERFLPQGVNLSKDIIKLFKEIIFEPMTIKGIFAKNLINDEIRLIRENFEAEYNDKTDYAFQQFKKAMFRNELYGLRTKGDYDLLHEITSEKLWNDYLMMLKNDTIQVSVVGDFDSVKIVQLLQEELNFSNVYHNYQWVDNESKLIEKTTKITEMNSVKQAKLMIGLRTDIRFNHPKYMSMVIFNTLLGDSDQSRLFQIIREKQHLCYYVSSTYDANKGVIFISMGIEPSQEEKAINLAVDILDNLKNIKVDDEEINLAKQFQNKRIRQRDDSLASLSGTDFYYRHVFQKPYSIEYVIESLSLVTASDLLSCANSLTLDTIYTLTGKEAQE